MGIKQASAAGIIGAVIGAAALLCVAASGEDVTPAPVPTVGAVDVLPDAPAVVDLERGGYTVEVDPVAEPVTDEPTESEPVAPVEVAPVADPGECLSGGGMYMTDGSCEPIPADWRTGDVLVCGTGAMPALDYREDVGWWAYCEPAMVD